MGDGSNSVLKIVLLLFLVGNLVMLGLNTSSYWDREISRKDEIERAKRNAAKIRRFSLDYLADIDRIDRGNFRKVDRESVYFEECLNTVGLNPTQDRIQIPIAARTTKGRRFEEEEWKLQFTARDKQFDLRTLCRLCDQIETLSPGFQIKEADFGRRSESWGEDLWKPSYISVRRLSPHTKTSR